MPDDVRTSVTDLPIESMSDSATMDHEIPEAVPSPGDPAPVALAANGGEPSRVEVTCGGCRRGLRIRSSYLGQFVVCQHCGQKFLARLGAVGGPEVSASPASREGLIPWPPEPRPAGGTGGFESLAARIRREFRLQGPPAGRRGSAPAGKSARLIPTTRPRDPSDDRSRGELDAALAEVARLSAERDEARARWDDERAGHPGAIERAALEARSAAGAELDALRAQIDLERTRAERCRRDAEEAGQGREAADRRADDLHRERDALIGRSEGLEGRARDLEARLASAAREAEAAADEAGRLRRDEVDGLTREREQARERAEEAGRQILALESRVDGLQAALDLERERSLADREVREGDLDDRAARLSEELAGSRSREDRDAARIASLESRVEELSSALRLESARLESETRARADSDEAARRRSGLEHAGLESDIAELRRKLEEAEGERDAERERASGLARGADELASRLSAVEPVLQSLGRVEAELARQAAELTLSREEVASSARQNALLLEQLGRLRDDWDARRREEPAARFPVDKPRPPSSAEVPHDDPEPAVVPSEPLEEGPGPLEPPLVEEPSTRPAVVPIAEAPAGRRGGPDAEVSIVLRGVSKEYYRDKFRIPVLQDLDLSVERGEFLALMGPSGSGKTTLLNLIAGLDQATAGSIVVHGRELTGLSEAQLTRWRANHVGFVFQMYNLVPVMTAFRNVELPLLLTRLSRRQRRENALTALRIVGLEGREDHYPRQLSGGQEQRVSIARAIVTDPYLIVADEPTGDLDRKSADEILDLLVSLNREFHKTIVMVTHDPQAAQRATRVLHLDKGKLVGDTTRPRIYPARSPA